MIGIALDVAVTAMLERESYRTVWSIIGGSDAASAAAPPPNGSRREVPFVSENSILGVE